MARLLDGKARNVLTIRDPVSGEKISLYYRIPTTEEEMTYLRDIWDRTKKRIVENTTPARIKWGMEIIEGFGEGCFERRINGEIKPISSNPESEHYCPDWKEWMKESATDLLELLGFHVFDGFDMRASQEEPPEKK